MSISREPSPALLSNELAWRGLVYQTSDDDVFKNLDAGEVTAYIGFDPTASSLHVGNLVQLIMLRRLQLAGNTPIVLAGGATGMIGDPSGKSSERVLLSTDQIRENVTTIKGQLEEFLDFSPSSSRAILVNNYDWLSKTNILDFLRDVGKYMTVNQMIAKDSVKSRMDSRDQGISYTEFSYMLLQATDFLHLSDNYGCNMQLGASDQWGNITAGLELIRKTRAREVFGMTTPLLLKEDGTKFGKSEAGAIYLDPKKTSQYDFYQFFYRSHDSVVSNYLKFFTFLSQDEILDLEISIRDAPEKREAQRELARLLTRFVHGESGLELAESAANALFSQDITLTSKDVIDVALAGAPTHLIPKSILVSGVSLVELLAESGLTSSRSDARKLVQQGGAYVNNIRCSDVDRVLTEADLLSNGQILLRKGKKDYLVISIIE